MKASISGIAINSFCLGFSVASQDELIVLISLCGLALGIWGVIINLHRLTKRGRF